MFRPSWSREGAVVVALIGMMVLVTSPVRAQNAAPTSKAEGLLGRVRNLQSPAEVVNRKELQALTNMDAEVAAGLTQELLLAQFQDPADATLGATLRPVDDTLRAQLDIAKGQGLLVTCLRGDGASAQAGLKQNDILLSLAGKPLTAAEDLTKQLKAIGDSAAPLQILRGGKPLVLQVRPVYHVTLGPLAERKAEYFIGVNIDATDEAVRAQLALPEGQGVVVNEVLSGSPAEKAGVQKHDIILELGGKPMDSPQTLARQVQMTQDKPTTLRVLRLGKQLTIPITAALRQVEANLPQESYRYWLLNSTASTANQYLNLKVAQPEGRLRWMAQPGGEDLRQRLDHVENELKGLRTAMDQLNENLRNEKAKKRE